VVLVTGGAGFLGSHLVDRLLSMGLEVIVLDNLFRGSKANLAQHQGNRNFRFEHGDILDASTLRKAVKGVDTVFHMAAINGTRYFYEQPRRVLEVNGLGTRNLLQAACDENVKRVVFASTSEVYGEPRHFPTLEDEPINFDPPLERRWSYAVSKLFGEHLCFSLNAERKLETVVLRYFNAYGPRLIGTPYGQVVAIFIRSVLRGVAPTIHGDGKQTRTFTYVTDSVDATIAAAESEQAVGGVFNIGSGEETTILDLAEEIIEICGRTGELKPIHDDPLPGDSRRRCPDTNKARQILGFQAEIGLKYGLEKTVQWFKETGVA